MPNHRNSEYLPAHIVSRPLRQGKSQSSQVGGWLPAATLELKEDDLAEIAAAIHATGARHRTRLDGANSVHLAGWAPRCSPWRLQTTLGYPE
jgi:hypothetical protein